MLSPDVLLYETKRLVALVSSEASPLGLQMAASSLGLHIVLFSVCVSWNQNCWEKYQNLRYADDTTLMAESEEELESFLMKVNEESEKVGLKLNIQKSKIMASSPITSCQIDGETVETMLNCILGGSKVTADSDCNMKLKDAYSLEGK